MTHGKGRRDIKSGTQGRMGRGRGDVKEGALATTKATARKTSLKINTRPNRDYF